MTAEPIRFDVVFDESGQPRLSDDAAAHLRAQLGHEPRPGETVTLALVEPDDDAASSDEAFEHWLRTEGVAAYDEMKSHPERNLSIDQVRAHFAAKLADAQAAGRE